MLSSMTMSVSLSNSVSPANPNSFSSFPPIFSIRAIVSHRVLVLISGEGDRTTSFPLNVFFFFPLITVFLFSFNYEIY